MPHINEDAISLDGLGPEQAQRKLEDTLNSHRQKLAEMERDGRQSAEKSEAIDKMVDDLRVAQAGLREAIQLQAERDLNADAAELRSFVDGDSIRWSGTQENDNADTYRAGLLDTRKIHGDWHRELKELVTQRTLARVFRRHGNSPRIDRAIRRHVEMGPSFISKRIFGAAGEGAEWIPTEMLTPDLDMAVQLMAEGTIAAQFRTVPMTTKVLTVPFGSSGGTPYLQGEPVDDPAQYTADLPGSANRTHTAKTFALRYSIDNDSAEDAIVDTYTVLREMIASDMVDGYEDAMINADTAGTHQDTGLSAWNPGDRWGAATFGTAADHRRAFIGLRARAFDISNTVDLGSKQTFDGKMELRSMLQSRSRSAVVIANEQYLYKKMFAFDELQRTDSAVGFVRDGRVTTLAGMPVFTSLFMTSDLNASGVYDNSTTTKAGIVCVDTTRFAHYERRGTLIELDRDPTRGQTNLVATLRRTFKTNDPAASGANVAYGFNLL